MFKVCTVPLVSRIRYLYFLPSYPLSSISTSRSSIFHHVPPTFDFSRIVDDYIRVHVHVCGVFEKRKKRKKKRHGGRHENQRRVRSEHRVAGEIYEIEERHRSSSSSSSHSAF